MKKILFPFILAVLVFLLASCMTSVDISYVAPSGIDMGHYRNIAVASTVPYAGFTNPPAYVRSIDPGPYNLVYSSYGYSLRDQVASYATERFLETLSNSGYFTIKGPGFTDAVLDASSVGVDARKIFRDNGIDAVVIPKIENMGVDEYIYSTIREREVVDKDGRPRKVYDRLYYYQVDLSLTFSFTIIDTQTEKVVAKRSFHVEDSDNVSLGSPYFSPGDPYWDFCSMIRSIQGDILTQLVPTRRSISVDLMANKPKDASVEVFYDYAKEGSIDASARGFLANWEKTGHLPSGYNAALLLGATGDIDEALSVIGDVCSSTGNGDAYKLQSNLQFIQKSNSEARNQIEGLNEKNDAFESSIYDSVRY